MVRRADGASHGTARAGELSVKTPDMIAILTTHWPEWLGGLATTLLVSGGALVLGAPLGLLIAACTLSSRRLPAEAAGLYRSFWRGTPILVQLLVVFYLLPLVGLTIPPVLAAIFALAFNTAAFQSEIYRSGLLAVPRGQIEAARLLGIGRWDAFLRIEAPQAVRLMLPALVGEMLALVKNSSLVSVIAVTEITRRAQQIASSTFRPLEAYGAALAFYLAIAAILAWLGLWLERRLATGGRA